ncbi:MAG: twin-arginine translocase TatA/TatE family subunit [Trueperaceae bacterium]|nr:twin-arginine translocase TatA/TatE family subunit [Trueperaceae bacterium]
MGRIGPIGIWELLIILALVLLIFGPRRLPEMAKGLGQAVREFRKGIRDMKKDFDDEAEGERPKGAPVASASTASATAPGAAGAAAPGAAGAGAKENPEAAAAAQGNGAGQA